MATFTLPRSKVSYTGSGDVVPTYFSAYWGANITGTYLSNPYRLQVTSISLSGYHKCILLPGGASPRMFSVSSLTLVLYSYKGSSTRVGTQTFNLSNIRSQSGTVVLGGTYTFSGSYSGSKNLTLASEGGKLRGLLRLDGRDYGMIWSSESYPSDYSPVNPDISINVGSSGINNITASLNSSVLTDLSSYTYTFKVYSDANRTQVVYTYTGNNINAFPLSWNGATGGTTYYWSLDASGVNSVTGGTVTMPTKTGTVSSQAPWINVESFTYSASPLFNNHWTPRTSVSYTLTASSPTDSSDGLTFKNFEIQTAINGLNSNTKSHRVTELTGTISLTDTSKWLRACKPRDLVYIKVRVCCQDNAGREYFSNWFGMINQGQYIYNKFHVYLSKPNTEEQLRINSRLSINGSATGTYWNKGEVR